MKSYLTAIMSVFPLKLRVSTKRLVNPWLTPEIRKEIDMKHELYKLKIEGVISKDLYSNLNSALNKKIFKAKKEYFSAKLNGFKGDMKKYWNFLNEIMNRKIRKEPPSCIENENIT